MRGLVGEQDLEALSEIEGATSTRLRAQDKGLGSLNANELVYGVPHAHFINASFAYAKPLELNRFNGPGRGAWYAALNVETCLAEVSFHLANFLARTGVYEAQVDYAEMFASVAGEYLDLRERTNHACLHPDPAISYPVGNALADAVRAEGLNGIIYPSVRHSGGTCVVALWPHAVQSVAAGDIYRLSWAGCPAPKVERFSGTYVSD